MLIRSVKKSLLITILLLANPVVAEDTKYLCVSEQVAQLVYKVEGNDFVSVWAGESSNVKLLFNCKAGTCNVSIFGEVTEVPMPCTANARGHYCDYENLKGHSFVFNDGNFIWKRLTTGDEQKVVDNTYWGTCARI